MKAQLETRLAELRSEFDAGQKALAELENKQTNLRNTLLRISGAIQVLEEELTKLKSDEEKPVPQPERESAAVDNPKEKAKK